MAFVKFKHRHTTSVPVVTGRKASGRLSFNRAAVVEYNLEEYKHCNLYFDKDSSMIGFEFLKEPEDGSVKVNNKKYSYDVAAQNFSTFFGIDLDAVKRCPISKKGEMFVISF